MRNKSGKNLKVVWRVISFVGSFFVPLDRRVHHEEQPKGCVKSYILCRQFLRSIGQTGSSRRTRLTDRSAAGTAVGYIRNTTTYFRYKLTSCF